MTFTNAALKELKAEGTKLEKKVINVLLDQGDANDIENYMKDVLQYGCQSGIVGELIYYNDTVAFFEKYKKDIVNLLEEMDTKPYDLNGWNEEDPLAQDTHNQNLLAWAGFEMTVCNIANQLGLDI